ncbi:cyclin-dependent kinase-like 4 isoform X2 [Physella acuta]|uniref:cyclin-dependent kinase-like 4 isoform X2 n=1 Tax=Physella acuta TaxID=109671 RepID=UPI0027DD76C4|nr:cyclin-dependent kinase-like 4 isoform X2 [Physella acuta]
MERYENLGLVGEGSYGMVIKCRHKETGQMVAIKKFLESEDDKVVQKIAMREVKMLKSLHHDNLVNLIETFRRRKRLYLVFEFVDHTILDELEKCPNGLDENTCRKILWQVLKGTEFCHTHNIIHRDIKPENILVSKNGIVKICDFGFARTLAQPGETYTDYVATRWYRSPELLVGDTKYGRAVDIWAIGCLLSEMLTGEPLFPGDSDIDQLYHIIRCFGNLPTRHKEVFHRNPLFLGMRLPEVRDVIPIEKKFTHISDDALNFIKQCLQLDPDKRPTCTELLKHNLFAKDGFGTRFLVELKQKLFQENTSNPSLRSLANKRSEEKSPVKDTNENQKSRTDKANKKKKKEREEVTAVEEKPKKKSTEGENKPSNKPAPPKVSSVPPAAAHPNEHPVILPPATASNNISHNNSSEGDIQAERENPDKEKKIADHLHPPQTQTASSIPPINVTSQPRVPVVRTFLSPAIVKMKNDEKVSPRNPLFHGNRTSSFSNEKLVKKVSPFAKKSNPVPGFRNSPQPIVLEKSCLHDKSLEKSRYKNSSFNEKHLEDRQSVEKQHDDRLGVCLPEVKGADVTNKAKEKQQQSPYKKSSISSIPQISNLEPFITISPQLDSNVAAERDGALPTV